jgi:hypothetical protein
VAKTRRAPEDDARRARPDDDAPRKARRRDDDEDDEGDDDEPFRPRKKRQSSAAPVKLILKICAAVAGAVLLIVLLYWVYSPVGTDYALLCYFPKETTRITGYDVEEGLKIGKMKDVHDMLINTYQSSGGRRFGQASGVAPVDVSQYLSGTAASSDPDGEKDLPPQERRGSITVIRFKKNVDQNTFIASFTGNPYVAKEQTSRDGKKYHQLYRKVRVPPDNHEEEEPDYSFFFPNGRTLVYTTTRRECEEALTRQPGRVVLEGSMRDLADQVDGHFFQASTGPASAAAAAGQNNSWAFGLGILDPEIKDNKDYGGVTGTASWFASNGNYFLYASATQYADRRAASQVRAKLAASFYKAQADIYQGQSGTPGGLEDPFNPKQPAQKGAAGGGFGGGGTTAGEASKDVIEALSEYVKTARVRQKGRLVIIEGMISHGPPEQGTFEKFWRAAAPKFMPSQQGGPFGGGGMPGPPGMGGPGMPGPMGPGGPSPGPPR